ncbi:MAG: DUF4190 domain-containing protein [Ruminococcus sp.]|nr:DUF4190 domain-containing protein [Ruminococcus sp.]
MDDFNTNNSDNGFSSEPASSFNTDFQSNDYVKPDAVYNQFDANESQGGGKGMSIAAMVLGIVAAVNICCCTYVGIICGTIAIILGIMSIKKNNEGRGMAIAGIICGSIGGVVTLILTIVNFVNIKNGNNQIYNAFMEGFFSDLENAIQLIIK